MMYGRPLFGFSSVYFLLVVVYEVKGTLTPSGTVSLDCGSQQTFTCSVSGTAALWTITGLSGITAMETSGRSAASSPRITDTNTSDPLISNITITGFTEADNGGTVQCIEFRNGAVEGMATVSIGTPSCPTMITSTRITDFTAANVVWSQPTTYPVASTTVTYCPSSSPPNCGNSVTCISPCNISGLDPCMNYSVTVTPSNNCGNATGCTMVDSLFQGVPDPLLDFRVEADTNCMNAIATWTPSSPVTSTIVTYRQSSMNSESISCTTGSPCTIVGLTRNEQYNITAVHTNNCGNSSEFPLPQTSPLSALPCLTNPMLMTSCFSTVVVIVLGSEAPKYKVAYCPVGMPNCNTHKNLTAQGGSIEVSLTTNYDVKVFPINNCDIATECGHSTPLNKLGPFVGCLIAVIICILIFILLVVVAVIVGRIIYKKYKVHGGSKRSNSTEPMKPGPGEEYADPQKVRENKESNKQGITYAALEFSEQAGSTGGQNVRSKGGAVQYMAVEHA